MEFVCPSCWNVFADGAKATHCPDPECGAAAPPDGFEAMPFRFKRRFEFQKLLGRGGQGAVFSAKDLTDQPAPGAEPRLVAVKVVRTRAGHDASDAAFRARLDAYNDEVRRRFDLESAAASLLGASPYFVELLGHEKGAQPYLVMAWVRWETLHAFVLRRKKEGRPLSPVEVAVVGCELLSGVAVMHGHNIIHRDLKPGNLFVSDADGRWQVKIADLGIWRRSDEQAVGIDVSVDLRAPHTPRPRPSPQGTVDWMSPEQQECLPLAASSDLHAVGAILWWLCTRAQPYPALLALVKQAEHAGSPEERLFAWEQVFAERKGRLGRLPERPPAMPERLYAVLTRALAFDPGARFQDATAFRNALLDYLREEHERQRAALDAARARALALRGAVESLGARMQTFEAMARGTKQADALVGEVERALAQPNVPDLGSLEVTLAEASHELAQVQEHLARVVEVSRPPPPPPDPRGAPERVGHAPGAIVAAVVGAAAALVFGVAIGMAVRSAPSSGPGARPVQPEVTLASRVPLDEEIARSNPWQPVPGTAVWMQAHEVSRREFAAWVRGASSNVQAAWAPRLGGSIDDAPMTDLTPEEAAAFCVALGGGLPTEATWDAVVAAWSPREAPFERASWPHPVTMEVAADRAPSGHRDLLSNVAEWLAPRGDGVYLRRGGSFTMAGVDALEEARSAQPMRGAPEHLRSTTTGFRCQRNGPRTRP